MNLGDIYRSIDPFDNEYVKIVDIKRGLGVGDKRRCFYVLYSKVNSDVSKDYMFVCPTRRPLFSCSESEFLSKYVVYESNCLNNEGISSNGFYDITNLDELWGEYGVFDDIFNKFLSLNGGYKLIITITKKKEEVDEKI
jgi:hypothetical protein